MITVLYPHSSSEISGGERSLLALWDSMDRTRFRPLALLPDEGPFADAARAAGIPVHVVPMPSWWSWEIGGLLKARQLFKTLVKKEKVGLIHSYGPRYNIMSSWVGRRRCPVIWHERNIPVAGEADISRIFFGWPDAFICNSRAVAARFPIHPRVEVIHNGVDAARFQPLSGATNVRASLGLPPGPMVGVVANVSPRKGLDIFLEVASRLPGVVFLVVGGTYGRASTGRKNLLQERAAKLGISDRVIWAGFQADPVPWIQSMDVICHPTAKEACSRAILEAMACGRPVVAFDDGGNPELMEDGLSGKLVRSGDVVAMAREVSGILDNVTRRAQLGARARARVEEMFTAERNAKQTMQLYERVLCG